MNRDLSHFQSEFTRLFASDRLLDVNTLLLEAGQT